MTAKVRMQRKTIAVSIDIHNMLSEYAKDKRQNITQVLENLIDWLPVYENCVEKELTVETAIAKLNQTVERGWSQSTDKAVSTKTIDKFSDWLNKLYTHNENAKIEDRVFITQRLLLNLTKGNVNMISKAYKEKENEIMAHNKKMGVDETTNRKLSHKIRVSHGTVSDWLIAVIA